jgi:hypothetical protein
MYFRELNTTKIYQQQIVYNYSLYLTFISKISIYNFTT